MDFSIVQAPLDHTTFIGFELLHLSGLDGAMLRGMHWFRGSPIIRAMNVEFSFVHQALKG